MSQGDFDESDNNTDSRSMKSQIPRSDSSYSQSKKLRSEHTYKSILSKIRRKMDEKLSDYRKSERIAWSTPVSEERKEEDSSEHSNDEAPQKPYSKVKARGILPFQSS